METLAVRVTHFFLQKHYIESDQAEWFQYGLVRRMMGALTFLLLLPIGAIVVGLGGSFFTCLFFAFCERGLVAITQKPRMVVC